MNEAKDEPQVPQFIVKLLLLHTAQYLYDAIYI
jgi:hypothetical protein